MGRGDEEAERAPADVARLLGVVPQPVGAEELHARGRVHSLDDDDEGRRGGARVVRGERRSRASSARASTRSTRSSARRSTRSPLPARRRGLRRLEVRAPERLRSQVPARGRRAPQERRPVPRRRTSSSGRASSTAKPSRSTRTSRAPQLARGVMELRYGDVERGRSEVSSALASDDKRAARGAPQGARRARRRAICLDGATERASQAYADLADGDSRRGRRAHARGEIARRARSRSRRGPVTTLLVGDAVRPPAGPRARCLDARRVVGRGRKSPLAAYLLGKNLGPRGYFAEAAPLFDESSPRRRSAPHPRPPRGAAPARGVRVRARRRPIGRLGARDPREPSEPVPGKPRGQGRRDEAPARAVRHARITLARRPSRHEVVRMALADADSPHFRIFGFPVRVRTSFLILSLFLSVVGAGKPIDIAMLMVVIFVSSSRTSSGTPSWARPSGSSRPSSWAASAASPTGCRVAT